MSLQNLSASQTAALFDILTHYDTYAEIREFRNPGSLAHYGPPFTHEKDRPSTAPTLQALVSRFLLPLPGLNNLPEKWWTVQCHNIIENLEKANLSESYDKGVIGSRKTVATAISALIEYPVRGIYGGIPKTDNQVSNYDLTNAEDLSRAFHDFTNNSVYGNALEELVDKAAQTDRLKDHTPLIKAIHEFVLINLASFMHYTLILSPKGQYLLKLIDNANKLVPYLVIKQTLKIGNVATMINAMMKVGLAKMSVASVTNWMGLTRNQDEGMNLMQTIISTVLNWDIKDLEGRASKLERERAKLGKEQLQILKSYTTKPQDEQDRIRKESQTQSISIVAAILRDSKCKSTELTEPHHKQALEYLSIHLSIRDRKQLIQCLCKPNPDYLTTSVREVVDAYEPVIRRMHKAIDLSSTVSDLEYFLGDMIKLSRIQTDKSGKSIVPTVGDFVQLLRKHQRSSHVFIHQCCKNDKELTGWYLDWAKHCAAQFKRESQPGFESNHPDFAQKGAGTLTPPLHELFSALPEEIRTRIVPILDSHSAYLDKMHAQSNARLQTILKSQPSKHPAIAKIFSGSATRPNSRASSPAPDSPMERTHSLSELQQSETSKSIKESPTPEVSSTPGPGSFLARWQALLDATPITPLTQSGPVKAASSPEVVQSSATDVDGSKLAHFGSAEAKGQQIRVEGSTKGDAAGIGNEARERQKQLKVVIDAMGQPFRNLLATKGCYW
ncbi:hypothetical protein LTR10_021135 [Elasticomyces elasticus]|uniref:Uncharacterized protein n=1 Tax=Exophiala sideris TaxID=1016849 RepID=A0ABR0JRT8_9EURO|nr:hypothetical protein LTR10_021135 [Elasticomyces elasticus]KAK5040325.1 hypothetical protein LTS07_000823 [Exophiala sideris]KAK5043249.1 hypothetical protein LTR13_001020 [Exophiala sideris]KAK5068703.1 hypothetical protein LTR69_000824 [Exophiala sideris]KAK5186301.1 hypothetical protein LTR44_001357 [Eurotiomycetes sp. CCFEE 6388]